MRATLRFLLMVFDVLAPVWLGMHGHLESAVGCTGISKICRVHGQGDEQSAGFSGIDVYRVLGDLGR